MNGKQAKRLRRFLALDTYMKEYQRIDGTVKVRIDEKTWVDTVRTCVYLKNQWGIYKKLKKIYNNLSSLEKTDFWRTKPEDGAGQILTPKPV